MIDHQDNPNLLLAARNLSDVQLLPNLQFTPYHVLNAKHVVFTKAATAKKSAVEPTEDRLNSALFTIFAVDQPELCRTERKTSPTRA